MKSKVLTKIVLVTEDDEICFCDKDFSKTCSVRISGRLPCAETIVRLTTVNRDVRTNDAPEYITALGKQFKNIKHSFLETLEHLERNRK